MNLYIKTKKGFTYLLERKAEEHIIGVWNRHFGRQVEVIAIL